MMFKVLVLQALYGLADERTEFQIRDRLSFMRFRGLDLHGRVPDARKIWLFREQLTKTGAVERLFGRFDAHLREAGYLAMGGQMIDVEPLERHWSERQWRGIVEAPRQRNTDGEKDDLRAGRIPEAWAANPARLRQKDRDGRWTVKRGRKKRRLDGSLSMQIAIAVYGYKSHIGADRRHRLIRTWTVTDAARHRRFTSAARRASRCPCPARARTQRDRKSARPSSTSSPTRSTAWTCSSGPSASRERARRSAWPTSPTTSDGSSGSKGRQVRRSAGRPGTPVVEP